MSEIPVKPNDPSHASSPTLASRGQRLIAAIIDAIVLAIIVAPIVFVLAMMGMWSDSTILSSLMSTLIAVATFVAVNFVFLREGQTIGKKVMNIRIVGRDNQLKSVDHLLLKRYAPVWGVGLIPYIGGLLGLANVLCIFRDSRACLHDDIADTKVITA